MIGAVDIGGTKIGVAAVKETGEIIVRTAYPTMPEAGTENALLRVVELLRLCEKRCAESFRGIGVGCTGPVDPETGIIGNVDLLPNWNGLALTELLNKEFEIPVAMENDADAAALAEAHWGAGRGLEKFVYVTISTGIGASIIIHGQLYRGVGGSHPELGHHTIDTSGPQCYCGARGCWESLASGPAMAEWMKANAGPDDECPNGLTARDVCLEARKGNTIARKAVDRQGYYIGLGLANLITILSPDAIALGGGVMESADLFLDRARDVIRSRCGLVPYEKTDIAPALLGNDAPLLGAARVWQHRFDESESGN